MQAAQVELEKLKVSDPQKYLSLLKELKSQLLKLNALVEEALG